MAQKKKLIDLKSGESGKVIGFDESSTELLLRRIAQMGLAIGKKLTVSHKPFRTRGPIAVQMDGQLLGLGMHEASHIFIEGTV